MKTLNVLIKPASGNCNLACSYCFYDDLSNNLHDHDKNFMSLSTLESIVAKVFEETTQSCTFAFQGGEPSLVGLSFYKKLISLQKKYNKKNIVVQNVIQTNGILMDEEWAVFFKENRFLVGLSLDGPKDIHDTNRLDFDHNGTHKKVMKTVEIFDRHKVDYNILFVVNGMVARHPKKVYDFFKKRSFQFLQFIPCLDPLDEKPGNNPYSLSPDKYGFFLKTIFDLWSKDIMEGKSISLRIFDNYVGMLMGRRPELCGMLGHCMCQFVIEANGNVYPCDFYVCDQWLIGNIHSSSFQELYDQPITQTFIKESAYVHPKCQQCQWFNLCLGGCKRLRQPFENGKPALNVFCSAYETFFTHAYPVMKQMAQMFHP